MVNSEVNNGIKKLPYHSYLFWILAVLTPICIKMAIGIMVNDIFAFILQRREQISDLVELNKRFGESGLGIVSTGVACLTTLVVVCRMLVSDMSAGIDGDWYGLHKIKAIKALIYTILACIMAIALNILVNITMKSFLGTYRATEVVLFSGNLFLRLVVLGIIVPVCEEFLFRGLVYFRLTSVVKTPAAIVISSILFGIYHLNPYQFVYAGIMGVLLALVYVKEKNIAAPIIAHAAANIVIILWEYFLM